MKSPQKESLVSALTFLGLRASESRIFLTLLQYGAQSVSNIARLTGIPRVNCYHYLEKLEERGLVVKKQRNKHRVYEALPPEVVVNQQKERLNVAKSILPDLQWLSLRPPQKPTVQFFEGSEGIKEIFRKMESLPAKSEIMSFSHLERLMHFDEDFLKQHFQHRVAQGIKSRFISHRSDFALSFRAQYFPPQMPETLLEVFLLPPQEFFIAADITIFPRHIAILHLNPPFFLGVLIEDEALFQTQKAIFDLAWLGGSSFLL